VKDPLELGVGQGHWVLKVSALGGYRKVVDSCQNNNHIQVFKFVEQFAK